MEIRAVPFFIKVNDMLVLILTIIASILIILYIRAMKRIETLKSEKQSLATRYGKMSEQFFPFLEKYSYDPQNFRFIGSPVDGVQFENDKIVFVEFKAGSSNLSEKQKRIKDIIEKKKVKFEEVRIN